MVIFFFLSYHTWKVQSGEQHRKKKEISSRMSGRKRAKKLPSSKASDIFAFSISRPFCHFLYVGGEERVRFELLHKRNTQTHTPARARAHTKKRGINSIQRKKKDDRIHPGMALLVLLSRRRVRNEHVHISVPDRFTE